MEQNDSTTKQKKYTHLSEKDRYKMEALLDTNRSAREIAVLLGRNRSTIHREVKRGTIERLKINQSRVDRVKKYRANVAQLDCIRRCKNRQRSLKIGADRRLEEYIRIKISQDRFSPDAIIGQIKVNGLKFDRMICTKTLYNYIDAGIFSGITHKDLWEKSKRRKRQYKTVVRVTIKNRRARSIEDRPKEINDRLEYGNWEGDTVKGSKGSKAGLLTLTERKTRQQLIIKVDQATHQAVQDAFDRLERELGSQFKVKFKSITFDNGSEFLNWQSLEASVLEAGQRRTTIYFAHSYSSWERGTNENQNRMIRRFVPKGYNIGGFSAKEIKAVEDWMNNYPRRILGYNTPNQAARDYSPGNSDLKLQSVAV
jgi:transposase, IS30 family